MNQGRLFPAADNIFLIPHREVSFHLKPDTREETRQAAKRRFFTIMSLFGLLN